MFKIDNEILKIDLPKKISHDVFNKILLPEEELSFINLNFEKTSFLSLAGVMNLICLSSNLCRNSSNKTKIVYCSIEGLKDNLLNILMNYGFFGTMVSQANLVSVNSRDIQADRTLLNKELKYTTYQKKKQVDPSKLSLIMPISYIPYGDIEYYDTYTGTFVNEFLDFYMKLIDANYFESFNSNELVDNTEGLFETRNESEFQTKKNFSDYILSITEIIKNIFNHSEAWGFGAIHAKQDGIEIVYNDLGIGIAESMRQNPRFSRLNNLELLENALVDGNTSKEDGNYDNQGRGFSVIKNFVQEKGGYLSILSSGYHISSINYRPKKVALILGTQIVIYIKR